MMDKPDTYPELQDARLPSPDPDGRCGPSGLRGGDAMGAAPSSFESGFILYPLIHM